MPDHYCITFEPKLIFTTPHHPKLASQIFGGLTPLSSPLIRSETVLGWLGLINNIIHFPCQACHFVLSQRSQLSYFCSLSYISTICPTCPTFFGFLSYILEICPTFLKFSFFSFQNQGKIAETYAYSKNVTLYCFLCQSCVDKYRYFVKQIATTLQVLRKTTFFKFLIFF